jgi:hypothetical protein
MSTKNPITPEPTAPDQIPDQETGHKPRVFRHARSQPGPLANNGAHNFALRQTMMIFGENACCTWIPKNACSTLRFSVARANGCVADLSDINWIHNNNLTFSASTETAFRASYTFTILRCPYARLYSVFMDKLVNFNLPAWQFYTSGQRKVHPHDLTFKRFLKALAHRPPASFDIHWKPQTDFLLFTEYDDVFSLGDFSGLVRVVKQKIGLEITDTRSVIGHDVTRRTVQSELQDPFNIPALDLLNRGKAGFRPDPKAMFDPEMVSIFKEIYSNDLAYYRDRFGNSALMDRFA